MRMIVLAYAILCVFSSVVKAGESATYVKENTRWIYMNKDTEFEVVISDHVVDGCWTNPSAVKTAVELELEKSGFKLADDNSVFTKTFYLSSTGYKTKQGFCVSDYSLELWSVIVDSSGTGINSLKPYGRLAAFILAPSIRLVLPLKHPTLTVFENF